MAARFDFARSRALVWLSLFAPSCLLVAPLEEYEPPSGAAARSGSGSGFGAEAGAAGDPGGMGGSGAGGSAGSLGGGGAQAGGGMSAGSAGNGAASGEGGAAGDPAGAGGVPDAGESGECETNADCEKRLDAPGRCRSADRTCHPLRTGDCPLVIGDYNDADAVFLGAFASIEASENPIVTAYRLAVGEFNASDIGGLPGPKGARRELVLNVCRNNSPEEIESGLDHLLEEVEVPGVIATLKPDDLRDAFDRASKHGTFFLSPVAATRALVTYPDEGLLWSLLGQPSDLRPTYVAVLDLVERFVRKERDFLPERRVKVALVSTDDPYDRELASVIAPYLVFNGLNLADNVAAGNFLDKQIVNADPQIGSVAQDIMDFGPDIVISAAGKAFAGEGGVLQTVEEYWSATRGDLREPFYILSPYNAGALAPVEELIESSMLGGDHAADATAYRRFVGISIASDREVLNEFQAALRRFGGGTADTGNFYDAVYFLAYATYAATQTTPFASGSRIAQGMLRLLEGPSVAVGQVNIGLVFQKLDESPGTVALRSTLGPPDFDIENGVHRDSGSLFCFERITDATVDLRLDVMNFDRLTNTFAEDATFPCYSGFYPPVE